MFAPLSPTSSRRLAKIHETSRHDHQVQEVDPELAPPIPGPSSSARRDRERGGGERRKRHRRDRSDPSSNRHTSSRSSRSSHNPERSSRRRPRSSSPASSTSSSDKTVVLPDRFDKQGRPLDAKGKVIPSNQTEMVERLASSFGDVMEGRMKWRDLLGEVVTGLGGEGEMISGGGKGGKYFAGRARF